MIKKLILGAAVAASLGAMAAPALADVYVRIAPPPMREEVRPEAREGYIWVPGAWNWRHGRHEWSEGSWTRERRGYRYNEARWEERNGRWVQRRATWSRHDRDGDGVPNNRDRYPDNPNRN